MSSHNAVSMTLTCNGIKKNSRKPQTLAFNQFKQKKNLTYKTKQKTNCNGIKNTHL
jgi:hypothetical protein